MGDLYLIRHAQASFGKPDYDRLSELGFRQARLLADFFEQTGRTFDALYCGEMKRHQDTAAALSQKPGLLSGNPAPRLLPEFNEFDMATMVNIQLPRLIREKPSLEADLEKLFTDPHILYRVLNLSLSRWITTRKVWKAWKPGRLLPGGYGKVWPGSFGNPEREDRRPGHLRRSPGRPAPEGPFSAGSERSGPGLARYVTPRFPPSSFPKNVLPSLRLTRWPIWELQRDPSLITYR